MPNIGKMLQQEMQRLARKELKTALVALRRDNVALKRSIADYRRRITALERNDRRTARVVARQLKSSAAPSQEETDRARITARMIRRIRERLGLSQADFAKLLSVNTQSVYQWEHKPGRLQFRGNSKNAILEARSLGVREARSRLEAMDGGARPGAQTSRLRRTGKASHPDAKRRAEPRKQTADKTRITARTILSLRNRLGLSQADLARLLGMNTQSIYQWEHKPGPLQFRGNAKAGILALQEMGTQQVKKRLLNLRNNPGEKRAGGAARREKKG